MQNMVRQTWKVNSSLDNCWLYSHMVLFRDFLAFLLVFCVTTVHMPWMICSVHTSAWMDVMLYKYTYLHAVPWGNVQEISGLQCVCKNNCRGCDLAASTGPWMSKPYNCSLKLKKKSSVTGDDFTLILCEISLCSWTRKHDICNY